MLFRKTSLGFKALMYKIIKKKFEQAVRHREIESEKETIDVIREFEHDLKIAIKKHENKTQGSK